MAERTFSIATNQRGQVQQLPGLNQLQGVGALRPVTTAQPGSISYVGAQVSQESVASAYNRDQSAKTVDWLMKSAGNVVEPYVKAYQNQQVMKGISEVAAGKSMDQIRQEQPWYSRIFGDSDLVTAASAYTAQTKVDTFITNIQNSIPNSANMSPEQFRNYMTQAWTDMQSGNMVDDAVMNQQFLNASNGLFEQWQKQNYKNLQVQAKTAQQGAFDSKIATYGSKARAYGVDQTVSHDDLLKSQAELIAGLQPIDGQTQEAWDDNLTTAVQSAAQSGNFHAIQAIKASGLLDHLPPATKVQLQSFINTQEGVQGGVVRISPKYAAQIQQLQLENRTGSLRPEDVIARVGVINTQAANEFGFTQPLIGNDEVAAWMNVSTDLVANEVNRQRMADISEAKQNAQRQANLTAKVALEGREANIAANRFSSGGLIPSGESTDTIQKVAPQTFDAMEQQQPGSGYASMVNLYANNNGLVIKGLQARFNASLNLADKTEWTPEFDENVVKPFAQMKSQYGGDNAAAAYYGPENYRKVSNYLAAMRNGIPQAMAYHEAFVAPERLGDPGTVNKKDRDSLASQVDPGWYSKVKATIGLGNAVPGQAARNRIMQAAEAHFATLKDNARYMDEDEKYEAAVKMAMNDPNLSIYGTWAWDRDGNAPKLHEQVQVQSDQLYGILHVKMEQMKQFQGLNLDNANFIERYDRSGNSTLMAYVPDGKGGFRVGILNASELRQQRDELIAMQKQERAAVRQQSAQPIGRSVPTNSYNYGQPQ